MTTIAWDGETLAADSQSTEEAFVSPHPFKKIHKVGADYIAFAGDVPQGRAFINWWKSGAEKPSFPDDMDDFEAFVFCDNQMWWYEKRPFPERCPAPFAIGSGACFAMAALLAGCDAKTAVDIACKLDKYSSKPIKTARLR